MRHNVVVCHTTTGGQKLRRNIIKFKVTIDREECISCGQCWEACPEFFEENSDDGFSQVVSEYRIKNNPAEVEAPEDLEDCVKEAADVCPVEIIDVEEIGD